MALIVLDDVGAGLIGAYDAYFQSTGRPSAVPARTPAIDTLVAAEGLMFTRAWSCPNCTPTRAALLTGRWGTSTGLGTAIKSRDDIDNPGFTSAATLLPEFLHAAAVPYTCAAVGKWHLADHFQVQADPLHPLGNPPGRWFDRFAGTFFNLEKIPGVPATSAGYFVWQKHFASYVQVSVDPCGGAGLPCDVEMDVYGSIGDYPSVDTLDDALALVQELPSPWFLYVAPHAVHTPLHDVPPGLPLAGCGAYAADPLVCDYPGLPLAAQRARCMLEALDAQIGRFVCGLDLEHTTLILCGDNGSSKRTVVAPYPANRAKTTVYEGGVHVPLIVRSPRLAPELVGAHSDALVSTIDLFATVLELAALPAGAAPGADSVSLVPYLTGQPSAPLRPLLYTETFQPNFVPDAATGRPPPSYVCKRHDQAVRDARFKLIRKWRREHGTNAPFFVEELYDLLAGGPPDPNTQLPTPDRFEANDLLASGHALDPEAELSLDLLRTELDLHHPTVLF